MSDVEHAFPHLTRPLAKALSAVPIAPYVPHARDHLSDFPLYSSRVLSRLHAGRTQYGDASFTRDPSELAGEIESELLDLMGWGFILWTRLRELHPALGVAPEPQREG